MKKVLAITLVFMVFFSGCYKKETVSNKIYNTIDENINAILIKDDDKSFIIVGKKYHYIFESNKGFKYLLQNINIDYKLDLENATYTISDKAYVSFNVHIDKSKTSKDFIIWALKHDAINSKQENDKEYLTVKIELEGNFYLPVLEVNLPKISREYHIKVQNSKELSRKTKISQIVSLEAMKGFNIVVVMNENKKVSTVTHLSLNLISSL